MYKRQEYTELLRRMRELPGIKRVFVRSGIRYDYMLQDKDRLSLIHI